MLNELLMRLALGFVPLLLGFTVHEAAHAYAAYCLGDKTAFRSGRMTLNPAAHIDPIGSIVLPLVGLMAGGVMFGWAKPVPVETRNFTSPRRGMFWVALAGPASNLAMALAWAIGAMAIAHYGQGTDGWLFGMSMEGVQINLVLMAFNLLPLPPLDGSKMIKRFLSASANSKLESIAPKAGLILLIIAFTGILQKIYLEPVLAFFSWVGALIGVPTL
jgi:Zn-dependent protease